MNEQPKVVSFPGQRKRATKSGDGVLADEIRKLYRKLCAAIDKATDAGLNVECYLDSTDTYGNNKVRSKDITITKKL